MKRKLFLKCLRAWHVHLFMALLFSTLIQAQNSQQGNSAGFVVKGIVRDNNGPLAGSSVSEKGKQNTTLTNEDGRFSLNVSGSNATLEFSFVGYKSSEVKIAGRSELNIVLESTSGSWLM
ncbi:MAG: carboxypeptidase-like regulatory domain-containing protein [Segetibacter sp.]